MGRIARQGRIIDAMLSDPAQTGVVAVARPEEMPVNETLALEAALPEAVGVKVDLVVANGLLPDRFDAADVRALRGRAAVAAGARRARRARPRPRAARPARAAAPPRRRRRS